MVSDTTAERLAHAEQAKTAMDRWVGPVLGDLKAQYAKIAIDVMGDASPKWKFWTRKRDVERFERLSIAIKVIDHIQAEIESVITDGAAARHDLDRARRLERMTTEQRRWATW